jgi:hypothetical protein
MASSSRRGHLPIPGCNHCVLCDAQWDAPDSGVKMADEEALRKIRSVEEQIDILNKKLSIAKQASGRSGRYC